MSEWKKNAVYPLTIENCSSEGEGVGHLEGMAVFVRGALPGEVCEVALTKIGKRAAWARLSRILTPSPARVKSDCPAYPRCGGCQMRHMTYEEELRCKRARVNDALRRIGGLDLSVSDIVGSPQMLRYRNKAVFPVSAGRDGVNVGFYRARSHDVVDVPECLLQTKEADAAGRAVKGWMEHWGVPAYDEATGQGLVRHVWSRTNSAGQCLICVMANASALPREDELVHALRATCPGAVGIVLGINTEQTNVILGREYRTLWGQDYLMDTLCGLSFRLSVPSFFQVNRPQAERLYTLALEYAGLTGRETVVDLYCGTGTISLVMAQQAGRVIGVEIVPEAVEDARENAQRGGFSNLEFLCADAGDAARSLSERGIRPDVVCVDPPRKGLGEDALAATVQMAPERVVYVSCDPATLARDLKRFGEQGYRAVKATSVDMFPRTANVECVVLLSRIGE